MRQNSFGQANGSLNIDAVDSLPFVHLDFVQWAFTPKDANVVHKNVDSSVLINGFIDDAFDIAVIGHITLYRQSVALLVQIGFGICQLFFIEVTEDD
jgi:hypothetical protein